MNHPEIHALTPELESFASEPFYQVIGNERDLFEAAARKKLPVLLKGPTGCGKTRFVEYMAWKLGRPLVTVACHDDLTSADLVGRYLLAGEETVWLDGPLTAAVRAGAICYLDEIVEARKDTTVVIHPLTDTRRVAAGREARRAGARTRRLPARGFLQPRLPERAQGTQAEHAAALRRAQFRLSAAGAGSRASSLARPGSLWRPPSNWSRWPA